MESELAQNNSALMICYFYPPLQTSGVQRSLGFSKHIGDFGWKPLILTVHKSKDPWAGKSGGTAPQHIQVETSYEFGLGKLVDFMHGASCKIVKCIFNKELDTNYFRQLLCIPDSQITWFTTFKGYLLRNEYKVIYVTCSPFSSAISGAFLKFLTKKPLVLDFRDPWPETISSKTSGLLKSIHLLIEKLCIQTCDSLILNTPGSLKLYQHRYPKLAEKFICIPNGFDSIVETKQRETKSKENFTIMHLGTFYGKRTPRHILEALTLLGDQNIEFVQIGHYDSDFDLFKNKINFRYMPPCTHAESLVHMGSADVLYIKQGFSQQTDHNTAIAAKTYEYLSSGIPILCDAPEGDNANIIRKYSPNAQVVTSNSIEDLAKAINKLKEASRDIKPSINQKYLDLFNRKSLSGQLAQTFYQLTASPLK